MTATGKRASKRTFFSRMTCALIPPRAKTASAPLVFASLCVVAIVQVPTGFIMRHVGLSVGVLANEFIAIAGIPIALTAILKFKRKILFQFSRPQTLALLAVAVMVFGAVILMDYLTAASEYFYPLPIGVKQVFAQMMSVHSTGELFWKLFILCLVPAFCEEIFFRGFCQTSLCARFGRLPAILIASAVFAILHGNPWYVHLYFILGFILGWIYDASQTLWAPILAHFLNNAWTFLNHVRGVELPLGQGFVAIDTLFVILGVVLFICGAATLRRPSVV